jgi:hypothetical protein
LAFGGLIRQPLFKRIPSFQELSSGEPQDLILDRFLSYLTEIGFDLYSAQEEAILALLAGENVILNTGCGGVDLQLHGSWKKICLHLPCESAGERKVFEPL